MNRSYVVRCVVDGAYVLDPVHMNGEPAAVIPTSHFGPDLVPPGTRAVISLETPEVLEKVRRAGRRYGYPECCIEAFVAPTGRVSEERRVAGQGTGFIPCPECARLVLAGKPLHELLRETREAYPFRYPAGRPGPSETSPEMPPGFAGDDFEPRDHR